MDAVEATLIPHIRPFPEPCSILVLDNCRIHHTYEQQLREVVEAQGGKLLFLAPHTPIDNPIEIAFNCMKMFWVRHAEMLNGMDMESAV